MAKKRNIEGQRLYHFELSDKNRTVRWVFIVVLLVIAVAAITIGITGALEASDGWQLIEVSTGMPNCSREFVFSYDLGAGEYSATDEKKGLTLLYNQIAEKAWQVFYNEAGAVEGVNGLYALNQNANKELTVEPELYQVLQQLENNGTRTLFFGPVYQAYDQVFYSPDEVSAVECDPVSNPEVAAYIAKLATYANDPGSVDLELRGNNRVFLKVSAEYEAFLKKNEVTAILDFGWLRNAFVIDYMAQQVTDAGFTNGYFSSVDGFTRNLDRRDTAYNLELYHQGRTVATATYRGGNSIVFLRSYPMYQGDAYRYYTFSDGRVLAPYVDLRDGKSKTAAHELLSYSTDLGCAELAMTMLPIYAADNFDENLVTELTGKNVQSVWFADNKLFHTDGNLQLTIQDSVLTAKKK